MSTHYDGTVNHAVLVGRVDIKKGDAYYYAHTSDRNANSNKHGILKYFDDSPKGKSGRVTGFYINS